MIVELMQVAAALYAAAALWLLGGALLPYGRPRVGAALCLAAGALVEGAAFTQLHTLESPPPLTDFPAAVALMAWVAVLFAVWHLRRRRFEVLAAPVAAVAFAAVLYASLALGAGGVGNGSAGSGWPHLHVILASAGLAALGVAGLAGLLFLVEDRSLKQKRPLSLPSQTWRRFPSLEALDRVNWTALVLGFPLLTVGVIAGMLWSQAISGRLWAGSVHTTWSGLAWAIYLALVVGRFGAGWRGRRAALGAAAGFLVLLVAVVGAEVVA